LRGIVTAAIYISCCWIPHAVWGNVTKC